MVTESPEDPATRTALFVVLPIFFLCYGGSCILYCLHKIYRYCRRRRRRHMRLERQSSFMEFEPETKPKPIAHHPLMPQKMVTVQEVDNEADVENVSIHTLVAPDLVFWYSSPLLNCKQ